MGMRRVAVTLVLTAGILGAAASRPNAQDGWTDYTKTDGRLSYSTPCAATWRTSVTDNAISGPYTANLGTCRAGDEIYIVGWVDYQPAFKPDTDGELKANQDNFVKSFGAVVLTSTPTTHQGMPALDFTANREQTYLVTSRVVMEGSRPYMFAIVTPINQDRSANIRKFSNSFRIAPRE